MHVNIKRQQKERRKLNKWVIVIVLVFALSIGLAYFVSESIASTQSNQQINSLTQYCEAYGAHQTSGLSASPTTNGTIFYCYYSFACAKKAESIQSTATGCTCDVLQSNAVVVSNSCIVIQA
jgi:uncharacterized BrkB/YihY/UPF0761 family membrane protein